MRILLNGVEVAALERGLADRLRGAGRVEFIEGVVLTADQAVETMRRRMLVLYGIVIGISGLILLVALWIAVAYDPGTLITVLPVYLVIAGGVALLVRFLWRRSATQIEARAAAQIGSLLGEPGAAVRVDQAGLTVGPAHFPWPELEPVEVSVVTTTFDESTVELVERLNLSNGGRTLVLDTLTLSKGPLIVSFAWGRLCALHAF